jgi:uncharacterized protein
MASGDEWDRAKALTNRAKHGVDFADAVVALEDAFAVTVPDPDFHAEERFVTIGRDAFGRLVVVIHATRGTSVRIISARLATRKERSSYEG